MKLLILSALLGAALGDCPNFSDWKDWSNCAWMKGDDGKMSINSMREEFVRACSLTVDTSKLPDLPDTLKVEGFPDKCGHCSFKIRCKTRQPSEGCFPFETERQTCDEHADVCDMPKTPIFNNCRWNYMGALLGQCNSIRGDIPEFKRVAFRRLSKMLPEQNCIEKDGGCKCCCHPFKPNAAGTACQAVPPQPDCNDFGEYNDWSECLWGTMKDMGQKFRAHCGIQKKFKDGHLKPPPGMLPEGFEMPEKCGFCSFQMRCRKRDTAGKPGCFPVEVDKKICGPSDECPNCGDTCELPKMSGPMHADHGPCDWHIMMVKMMKAKAGPRLRKMKSYWRKRGFMQTLKYMPTGRCVESGDVCKCCCHPYEPSDDGSECTLKEMCKLPEEHGITLSVSEKKRFFRFF